MCSSHRKWGQRVTAAQAECCTGRLHVQLLSLQHLLHWEMRWRLRHAGLTQAPMSMEAALMQYHRLWRATAAGRCRARTLKKKKMMDAAFAGAGPRKLEYCMEPGTECVPNIKCLLYSRVFIVMFVRNSRDSMRIVRAAEACRSWHACGMVRTAS